MDEFLTFGMFFLFGGVFILAVARSGRRATAPAASAIAPEPAQGSGNITVLFFVMLAMMFVVASVV